MFFKNLKEAISLTRKLGNEIENISIYSNLVFIQFVKNDEVHAATINEIGLILGSEDNWIFLDEWGNITFQFEIPKREKVLPEPTL